MSADHADREALIDAFLASLRALLLAGLAEGCAAAAARSQRPDATRTAAAAADAA